MTKWLVFPLAFLGVTVLLTCTGTDDSKYNPISGTTEVRAIGAVFTAVPDTSGPLSVLIANAKDSATVTINDTLYFVGFTTDTGALGKLQAAWLFGDGAVDSGFGLTRYAFSAEGLFIAQFIMADMRGNRDTVSVSVLVTDAAPVIRNFLHDTLINLHDLLTINDSIYDDGRIVEKRWYCHLPVIKNAPGDTAADTVMYDNSPLTYRYESPKVLKDTVSFGLKLVVIDDDGNRTEDSAGISIVLHYPRAHSGNDTIVTPHDTVVLNGAGTLAYYGIRRYIWKSSFFSDTVASAITTCLIADTGSFPFVLSVEDVMGNISTRDTMVIRVVDSKPAVAISHDTIPISAGAAAQFRFIPSDAYGRIASFVIDTNGDGTADSALTVTDTIFWSGIFTVPGQHLVVLSATDDDANRVTDTVYVYVNSAPDSVVLINPADKAVEQSVNPVFTWNGYDHDYYDASLLYTMVLLPTGLAPDTLVDGERGVKGHTLAVSLLKGETVRWYVTVQDSFGAVTVSDTAEFTTTGVGEYATGRVEGYAFLQGMANHTGIKLTAVSQIDTLSYSIFVNSSGYFQANILPRTYTITAVDTLHSLFTNDAATVVVVAGDTTHADTLVLRDTIAPNITCTNPAAGDTLTGLSPRTLALSGTFSDVGSQVKPDSVVIALNGSTISGATLAPTAWSFTVNPIADGHYTVTVLAKDGAGLADTLTRSFTVNSKLVAASQSTNHDTLTATVTMTNARPGMRAYYWDVDGNGTWEDSTVTADSVVQYRAAFDNYTLTPADTLYVKAVDDSGMAVYDTVFYTVGSDTPVAFAGNDTSVNMGTSLLLHGSYAQTYGHVVKWEWKIDNSAYLVCSGPDTTITPPSKYRAHYPCILRITDDNGAIDEDTMFVTTGKTWEVIGGGALSLTNTYNYSMDIDYFGTVCIVYTDSVPSYINHVFAKKLVGSAWVDMGSGSVSGSAADAVDLTIGYEQNIGYAEYYLAFHQKYVPGALILKKFNGTSWEYAPNYTQIKGDIGNAFDIELSETSVFPSIAYRDSANGYDGVVRYLNTSVNWVVRNTTISQYWTSEMALSSGGTAICWNGLGTYYIATSNSGWNIATVSGFNPKNPDILDLTKLGITNIYVSFRDGTLSNRLSVKSFNGTSWSDVGSPGISVSSASKSTLVEDRGGARDVYLAYVDYANGTFSPGIVKVSTFDGTEWINVGSTQIGTQYPLTTSPAIAVREGQLFVAFQDYNNNNRLTVMALR